MDSQRSVVAAVLLAACLISSGFDVQVEHACRWLRWSVRCQRTAHRARGHCEVCFPPAKSADQIAIEAEEIALWSTL